MVALQLLFEPPNRVCIERCQITTNGVMVKINPNEIVFQGEELTQLTISGKGEIDANIGILIGDAPRGASVAIKTG